MTRENRRYLLAGMAAALLLPEWIFWLCAFAAVLVWAYRRRRLLPVSCTYAAA